MNTAIYSPSDCSSRDLQEFESLVIAGDAVNPDGLSLRIRRAFRLLFLRTPNGQLAGISALKRPNIGYRNKIFQEAHSLLSPNDYNIEVGWVVVSESHRGQRYPIRLIAELLPHTGNELVFGTTRADKFAMQYAFADNGFQKEGKPYSSEQNDYNLILYVLSS